MIQIHLPTSGSGNAADAEKFITDAEKRLLDLNIKSGRAEWIKSTFITDDTEALAAEANEDADRCDHRTRRTGATV